MLVGHKYLISGFVLVLLAISVIAVNGKVDKIQICHKGKTMTLASPSAQAHLAHGDYLGACGSQGQNFAAAWNTALASASTTESGTPFQQFCDGVDITRDTKVNINDLSLLAFYWQQTCAPFNNFCQNADINHDFQVNIDDLSLLAANWQRTDCSYIPLGTWTCCTESGCYPDTIDNCRASGGYVNECTPTPEETTNTPTPGNNVSYAPFNTSVGANSDWLTNLTRAVDTTGINNTGYVPGTYDCDDFADDLERNLTAAGYHATYTYYWCVGPPAFGHAITDVHTPDGGIVWVEPQTGKVVNIDFDGDGKTETRNGEHVNNLNAVTDDNCAIEVFESAAAAAAAGTPRD